MTPTDASRREHWGVLLAGNRSWRCPAIQSYAEQDGSITETIGVMMSTMTSKLLALALGASLISGCASQAPAPVDTTADQTALKEITATWFKSYNAGDADTGAALYAEDAVLMPPHAPVARGRAAIRAFLAKDSADAKSAGLKLFNGAETAGVNGDWGWNSGSYTVQDGSGQTVDSGSYLSVSHKVNGKWLYVRDTYNSDQPLPAPPQAK